MLALDNIDDETQTLFSHLRGLASGQAGEDTSLVVDFRLGLPFHVPSLYSFLDSDGLYNPVIKNLVQLLLRVMPAASVEYSELLERVVAPLKFDEMCIYISPQAIVEGATNPATQAFTLNILQDKINRDASAVRFVAATDLIYTLVAEVVQSPHDRIALADSVFHLIMGVLQHDPKLLPAERFEFLQHFSQDQILTPTLFCNYVSVLSAIVCIDFSHQPWAPRLFPFDFRRVMAFDRAQTSGVWFPLLAKAYRHWLGTVPFAWLRPFVSDLLYHVVQNCPDRLALTYTDDYVIAFQDILVKLSMCGGDTLQFAQEFLSRPDVDIVDKNVPSSHHFFSEINLAMIPHKHAWFASHFADLDVKSGGEFACHCIFALIKNPDFFRILVENKMLTSGNLRNWQKHNLFAFMKVMANYDHSAQYLVSDLPYLVSTYLLTVDPTISSKNVWDDKRRTLRRLLLSRNIDLGMWKSGLSDCLYEMENGRRLINVEPQVGIMNATMMG